MKTPDIDTLTRQLTPVSDEQAGSAVSPAARSELAGRIMDSPLPVGSRHRVTTSRRLVIAAAVLTVLAGSTVVASKNWPGQDQPRALSVTDQGNAVVVRVIDPLADPKRYNKEFKKLGLDIKVRMVPVSPPSVGKLITYTIHKNEDKNRIQWLEAGEHCAATLDATDSACQPGVRVLKTFEGESEIWFGRAARRSEMYHHTSSSADAPGEAMHGLKFRNRTVAEVLPLIAGRGLVVAGYNVGEGPNPEGRTSVPGTWYVHAAVMFSPEAVSLWVGPIKQG